MSNRPILRSVILAAFVIPLFGWEAAARAQPSEDGIAASLWYAHSSVVGSSANAFNLNASALLSFGSFGAGVEIGAMAAKVAEVADTTKLKFLNPFLGAYYGVDLEIAKLQVGAGVSLPILKLDNASITSFTTEGQELATSLGGRGAWNQWMYTPSATTFVLPARLSVGLLGLVGVAAEGALAISHTGNQSASGMAAGAPFTLTLLGGNDFIYQVAGEAYLGLGFEPGLRVQWVHMPTAARGGNDVEVSVIPFVRVGFGPVHAQLALLYNVSSPYGPSFGDSTSFPHAYSLHVGASLSL
jgi:hypothetical protein